MVVSQRRIDANRANAQKSTGPRTAAGKVRAARNRIVHGLCSRSPVVPGEDPKEYEKFLRSVFNELDPRGQAQEELAVKFAAASWKLRRADPAEARIFAGTHGRTRDPDKLRDPAGMLVSMATMCDGEGKPNSPVLVLDRYAHGLERSRNAALRLLMAMQKKQKEEERVEAAQYPEVREEDCGAEDAPGEVYAGDEQVAPAPAMSEGVVSERLTHGPPPPVRRGRDGEGVRATDGEPPPWPSPGVPGAGRKADLASTPVAPEQALSARVLVTPFNAPLRFEATLPAAPPEAQVVAGPSTAAETLVELKGAGSVHQTHSAPTTPVSELKAMTRIPSDESGPGGIGRESERVTSPKPPPQPSPGVPGEGEVAAPKLSHTPASSRSE